MLEELKIKEMFPPLSEEEAVKIAKECKGCKKECLQGCTLNIDIPKMMKLTKQKKFEDAHKVILESNKLPSVTGRLCSAPCETKCPKNIPIKSIERFLSTIPIKQLKPRALKKKIAIVGTGAGGLMSAKELAKHGYNITMFEALPVPGGSLRNNVAEFRFPKDLLNNMLKGMEKNISIKTNTLIGNLHSIQDLSMNYHAVILATGANKPMFYDLPGENLVNVFTANEFLKSEAEEPGTTFVFGGNNIALDCAVEAKLRGDKVTVIYEKSLNQMRVNKDLLKYAQEVGVKFMLLTGPAAYLGEDKVHSVRLIQMVLSEGYFGGSVSCLPLEDSEFELLCDRVVLAYGFDPNPTIAHTAAVRMAGKNKVWTNEDFQTTIPNVFALGGLVKGDIRMEDEMQHAKHVAEIVRESLR